MVDDGSGGHAGRRVPRYAEANEGLSRPRIRRGGPALQQRGMSGESKSPDGRREGNLYQAFGAVSEIWLGDAEPFCCNFWNGHGSR